MIHDLPGYHQGMVIVVLLIVALILFILAASGAVTTRVNLMAAGLAFWVLAELINAWPK